MFIFSFILAISSTLFTYQWAKSPKVSPTQSSAFVSLFLFLLLFFLNKIVPLPYEELCALSFGASFIGMSSPTKATPLQLVIAAIIFSMMFHYLSPRYWGIGGALGFSAFVSLLPIHIIRLIKIKS